MGAIEVVVRDEASRGACGSTRGRAGQRTGLPVHVQHLGGIHVDGLDGECKGHSDFITVSKHKRTGVRSRTCVRHPCRKTAVATIDVHVVPHQGGSFRKVIPLDHNLARVNPILARQKATWQEGLCPIQIRCAAGHAVE